MSGTATPPTPKFKAKQFRVATEGATTDGRTIDRAFIEQMARNYDPKKYGARIWMEHIRGTYADSTFRAYGDVLALEAKPVEDGKLGLFATLQPLPDLVDMTTKAKQKIYTSVEISPKFADTGEAYLTGLAVTDSPASLGTEVLSFAAQNPKANPFASRKSAADALFSAGELVEMAFDAEPQDDDLGKKFTAQIKGLMAKFTGRARGDDERFGAVLEAMEAVTEQFAAQATAKAASDKQLAELQGQFTKLQADQVELRKLLDTTDASRHSTRPPATGGPSSVQTDC